MEQALEHGMVVRRWGPAERSEAYPGGGGPAIVYIHGLGEAGLCFAGLIREPALAGFTHVIPDLPGYGRSDWPARAQSLDELADLLAAWLARFPAPSIVVGHSMGGVLGVMLAERAPGGLAALINVDGNVSIGDCTFSGPAAALTLDQIVDGGFDRIRDGIFADAAREPVLRGYYAALRFADPASYHRHAIDLVEQSRPETMAARIAKLSVPTTFVAGVPGGICERSRELLSAAGARWIAVEPAGHWVYIDQPARCAAIIATAATAA